jgi:hypothetical protein
VNPGLLELAPDGVENAPLVVRRGRWRCHTPKHRDDLVGIE